MRFNAFWYIQSILEHSLKPGRNGTALSHHPETPHPFSPAHPPVSSVSVDWPWRALLTERRRVGRGPGCLHAASRFQGLAMLLWASVFHFFLQLKPMPWYGVRVCQDCRDGTPRLGLNRPRSSPQPESWKSKIKVPACGRPPSLSVLTWSCLSPCPALFSGGRLSGWIRAAPVQLQFPLVVPGEPHHPTWAPTHSCL